MHLRTATGSAMERTRLCAGAHGELSWSCGCWRQVADAEVCFKPPLVLTRQRGMALSMSRAMRGMGLVRIMGVDESCASAR
jgi:hypothetical protein